MMLICIKQHLSNTWSLIHEKVRVRVSWKNVFLIKTSRGFTFSEKTGGINRYQFIAQKSFICYPRSVGFECYIKIV